MPISINMGKFEKSEMVKNRPLTENTCYDWFINHIPESV